MDLHAWLNSLAVFLSLGVSIWFASRRNFSDHIQELATLKVKVDTMWGFLLKRAVVEGLKEGMITVNSPVRLVGKSSDMFIHMAGDLRKFYETECSGLDERELALAIERKFGDRIIHEICVPNGIQFGTCLLMATAIAKGGHTLTEILDEYHIPKQ